MYFSGGDIGVLFFGLVLCVCWFFFVVVAVHEKVNACCSYFCCLLHLMIVSGQICRLSV